MSFAFEEEEAPLHSTELKFEDKAAYVRPTRQLLEFYRKKIAEYENEHEVLIKKFAELRTSCQDCHQLECEMKQRENEISELQKALSDMQVFLFKEREQVLNLYGENDAFKARDLEDKRTIQQLLALQGGAMDEEVSYFFKEPPEHPIIPDRTGYKTSHQSRMSGSRSTHPKSSATPVKTRRVPNRLKQLEEPDEVTLSLQVEALESQIADQARWAKEFIEALHEDKRIKAEEHETCQERDLHKLKILTDKLHKTQDLLYHSTQDILKLRKGMKDTDKQWRIEKDELVLELDKCRGRLSRERDGHIDTAVPDLNMSRNIARSVARLQDNTTKFKIKAKKFRGDIEEARRMSEMYREQVISLEDEVAAYTEKENLQTDIYKDKMDNMSKRYDIMKKRYADLEKRRNLEVEGYKNDVKSLRKQVKDLERRLYRRAVESGIPSQSDKHDDLDLAVLNEVKKKAHRSLKLNQRLKGVKKQVYEIEHNMKQL